MDEFQKKLNKVEFELKRNNIFKMTLSGFI